MKKLLIIFLIFFIYESSALPQKSGIKKGVPKILILNSYHKGFPWTDKTVESIEKYYSEHGISADFYIEYMDTKRYFSKEYFSYLFKTYLFKYSHLSFNCVMATDDDALNFLIKNGEYLFPDTPVVFSGINSQSIPITVNRKKFTGIMEEDSPEETIRLIQSLKPGLKKIYVICDYTTTGRARFNSIHSIMNRFENISFIFSPDKPVKDVLSEINMLNKDVPLLILAFFKDRDGKDFTYKEFTDELYNYANGPVFTVAVNYMNRGVIGGVLNSPENQGHEAAAISIRLIKGESPENIPIITKVRNIAVIDYHEAVLKGVDLSHIPEGTLVKNRPEGFYNFVRTNKDYVLIIISFFLFITVIILTVSIVIVMRTNRNRKRLLQELSKALIEVKTLGGLLPICSSCKKIRDDSGYWSQIEQYLEEHSDAEFTHSLCPDCAKKLYPDIFNGEEK